MCNIIKQIIDVEKSCQKLFLRRKLNEKEYYVDPTHLKLIVDSIDGISITHAKIYRNIKEIVSRQVC